MHIIKHNIYMSINGHIPDFACNSLAIKGKTIIDSDRNIKANTVTVKNLNVRGYISKKFIQLPDNDIVSFIPIDGALYMNKNYTGDRTLTLIDEDIENKLQLKVGEYISFYIDSIRSSDTFFHDISLEVDGPLQVVSTSYWDSPVNDYCYHIALLKTSDTFPRYSVTNIGTNG